MKGPLAHLFPALLRGFPLRALVLGALLVLGASATGCRSYAVRRDPLTTAQVIQLSQEKRPPEEVIQKIRESRTVYILHARDVKDLLDRGVDERVVDEMLQTRIHDLENYYQSWYYYPYPYYYGPHFGFGYGVAW
jgi:hypothetical protein